MNVDFHGLYLKQIYKKINFVFSLPRHCYFVEMHMLIAA